MGKKAIGDFRKNASSKAFWKAFRIASSYAIFGIAWIWGSDWFLYALTENRDVFAVFSVYKGFLFVIITSLALFLFLFWEIKRAVEVDFQLQSIVESLKEPVAFSSKDTILWANRSFAELFGYSSEEICLKTWGELIDKNEQAGSSMFFNALEKDEEVTETLHFAGVKKSGERLQLKAGLNRLEMDGKPGLRIQVHDISELDRAMNVLNRKSRTLQLIYSIHHLILFQKEKVSCFREVCRKLVEIGAYSMAWYGEPDSRGKIEHLCSFGDKTGYLDGIIVTVDDSPTGHGPVGTTYKTRELTCIPDIESDANMGPWQLAAKKAGYRAIAGVPVFHQNEITGVLAVYSTQNDTFNLDEIGFLQELSRCLSHFLDQFKA